MPNLPSPPISLYEPQTTLADPFRRVTPHVDENAAGAVGAGLEQVAQTTAALQAHKDRADAATAAANTATDLAIATAKGVQSARESAAPDASGYTDGLLKDFDKTAGEIQTQHADKPLVNQFLQPHLNQLREHLALTSMEWEAQQRVAFRANSVIDNTNKAAALVEADPTLYETVGGPIMQGLQSSGFQPEVRLKLARTVDDTLSLAAARGMATQNPRGILDQIQHPETAGSIIAGLTPQQREVIQQHAQSKIVQNVSDGVVSTYRTLGPQLGAKALASIDVSDMPDFMKDEARKQAMAGVGQWQAESRQVNQAQIISLEEGLNSGQPPADARAQIFSLHNKGAYGPEETATKLGQADRAELKAAGDAATIAWAQTAYAGDKDHPMGRPLDAENPDVKTAIDGLFNHYSGNMQAGTPEWTNRAADIAFRTGVAPATAVSWGRAQLISGDPKLAAQGADVLARLQEASPRGSPFAIDEKTEALVKQINDSVRAGGDPAQAVAMARHNTALPDAERKFLESRWLAKVPEKNFEAVAANAIVTQLKGDPRFKPGFFSSVPAPSRELAVQYGNLVHEYFLYTGGNMEQAQGLAAAAVSRTWGVTEVNGKREIMPYAPESMFPGLTADMIHADLAKHAAEMPDVDPAKVRLTPTSDTARTNGFVWQLTAPNKFGSYDTVVGKNGRPRQYTLPVTGGDAQAELDAAREAGLAQGRKVQQGYLEAEKLQRQALQGELEQTMGPGSLRAR